jgi:predicted ATPase
MKLAVWAPGHTQAVLKHGNVLLSGAPGSGKSQLLREVLIPALLIPILWVMLVLTAVTAVQRFVKVWKQAGVAPITAAKIEMRRSRRQSRRVVRTERRRTRISRLGGQSRNEH